MIYPQNFEQKIGFDAVRAAISRHCISAMGSERCGSMAFSSDFAVVAQQLGATDSMFSIVSASDDIPLSNVRDIRPVVAQIAIPGTYASLGQIGELRRMLVAMAELSDFFARRRSDDDSDGQDENRRIADPLDAVAMPLSAFPALLGAIDRVIDRYGNMKDNASPALAELRSRLRSMSSSINSVMRRVMARAAAEGLIDKDAAPTVRDGRLVLPVAPMYKRKVPGIVHDESATGKTVYIEPAEVVEANNALRTLEIEEQREQIRVLTALSDTLRPHCDELLAATDVVGHLDFIHAKALYAIEVDAHMPYLDDCPTLEWYHACHPVLIESLRRQDKQVVPLDIILTPEARILVISGPNAGGKSVCLKTVGINQYMAQCGVLPSAYDNSHFGIFSDIFIDIGDDQSIENDLSTYSSHLRNMRVVLTRGNSNSLILADEFGAGTEPQIGAAIAQAMLHRFNTLGMWGVVTTHYQNLKHFAEEQPGMINGSMLYDRQLMQPLFRLSIGVAGSSFAIEIARKTGVPADIIAEAESIVGTDYINVDRYLLDVARDKKYWENKRQNIRRREKHLEEVISRYEAEADQLREKRREIISDAREEARQIVGRTNAVIERTISEIRRTQAEREQTLAARRDMTAELGAIAAEAESDTDKGLLAKAPSSRKRHNDQKGRQQRKSQEEQHKLQTGDNVRLDGEGTVGTILSIEGKKATVAFGNLKTSVPLSRLRHTTAAVRPASSSSGLVTVATSDEIRRRQLAFRQDIDVRGMRADEAIQAVTYFLDDAIQFNIQRVRILHGTGTGALRQAIRAYLATVPGVSHFADEHVQFGGAGITVVDLA